MNPSPKVEPKFGAFFYSLDLRLQIWQCKKHNYLKKILGEKAYVRLPLLGVLVDYEGELYPPDQVNH